MTQVKKYRMGSYELINGHYVLKNYNRTYRRKTTKHVQELKFKEFKSTLSFFAVGVLMSLTVAFIETTNRIDIVAAEGAKSEDVIVKDEAPNYAGIPYMETTSEESTTEGVASVEEVTKNNWKSIGTMTVSAYSELDSCHYPTYKNGYRQCLVASGKIAKVGMAATNLYPFGTRLMIDGDVYIVEDRISKTYNNRIDLFQGYSEEGSKLAKEFGIKKLEIKVLKN
ncbi:MAG: 3D domain-containing protein [Patescibacteria group bacterium]